MSERPTYQEQMFEEWTIDLRASEQLVKATKDPDLKAFHQDRVDFLRGVLSRAGVIFEDDKPTGSR